MCSWKLRCRCCVGECFFTANSRQDCLAYGLQPAGKKMNNHEDIVTTCRFHLKSAREEEGMSLRENKASNALELLFTGNMRRSQRDGTGTRVMTPAEPPALQVATKTTKKKFLTRKPVMCIASRRIFPRWKQCFNLDPMDNIHSARRFFFARINNNTCNV